MTQNSHPLWVFTVEKIILNSAVTEHKPAPIYRNTINAYYPLDLYRLPVFSCSMIGQNYLSYFYL